MIHYEKIRTNQTASIRRYIDNIAYSTLCDTLNIDDKYQRLINQTVYTAVTHITIYTTNDKIVRI